MHARLVVRELNLDTGGTSEIVDLVISAQDAWDLIGHLMHVIDPGPLVREIRTGDCPVCQNTRLIQTINQHNRSESVRCTACGPRWSSPEARAMLAPYGRVPITETEVQS